MEREEQITELCKKVVNVIPEFYDNPNGGYENTCPYCYKMGYGDYKRIQISMEDIEHDVNCAWLIAKDLLTGID
jgi:hypothetical protein